MAQSKRRGNFTSSEIAALISTGKRDMTPEEMELYKRGNPKGRRTTIEAWPGKAAQTYIQEKNYERRLERSIDTEVNARPIAWGKLVESIAFEKMGLEYTLCSQETIIHPDFDYWVGSPDGTKTNLETMETTVIDLKCPITLNSFCQLVQPLYDGLTGGEAITEIRENHKDGEKYYWQLVSNAILTNSTYAELVVYMPYQRNLEEIKSAADGNPSLYWLTFAGDNDLPYLNEGGYYTDLNVIRFEVPQEDKDLLTQRVIEAGKMLIPRPSALLAEREQDLNTALITRA